MNKEQCFYLCIGLSIIHFVIFAPLILIYRKGETPKDEGTLLGSVLGFGMSFVYLIEAFGNI